MLVIPTSILDALIAQARREAPMEACAILAGRGTRVERFFEMTNADAAEDHFMLVPAEQFAVAKQIRASGLDMLAVCHSHPASPARPSAEDIRLALTPGLLHVIVSLAGERPVAKGFRIEDGSAAEIPVEVVDG